MASSHAVCRNHLHEMTDDNIYVTKKGSRRCRQCLRECDKRRHSDPIYREQRYADVRARNAANRSVTRERNLMRKFGLTVDAYDALLAGQGGVCAICGTDEPGGRWNRHFHVDHDHLTGAIRGLLCSHCNVMLGNANDEPDRLRAAADYLENA